MRRGSLERFVCSQSFDSHLVKLDFGLRNSRLDLIFDLRRFRSFLNDEGKELLAKSVLAQELYVLVVHDLNHVVEASDDVRAEEFVGEFILTSDFSLEKLKEVADNLFVHKWRILGSAQQEDIIDLSDELCFHSIAVDDLLSFRRISIVIEAIDFLLLRGRVELEV